MSSPLKTIRVEPGSELDQLLAALDETDILLEREGRRYRLNRLDAPGSVGAAARSRLVPERVLNVIGLGAAADGSDIAQLKDRYVADAVGHRGE